MYYTGSGLGLQIGSKPRPTHSKQSSQSLTTDVYENLTIYVLNAEMNSKFYYLNSCDQNGQLIDYSLSTNKC